MDDGIGAYTNVHRAFLQCFLARGALTLDSARPVLAAIQTAHEGREVLAGDITESSFNSIVSVINSAVSEYDFEIRSTFAQPGQSTKYGDENSPSGRGRIYAIINTTSDVASQLATSRTTDELAFMGRVLDDMFDKYNHESGKEIMAITHNQAVRLNKAETQSRQSQRASRQSLQNLGDSANGETQAATRPGLTLKQAESLMHSFVDEGWLERVGHGRETYYMLTPRALLELKGWLVDTFNEPGDPEAPDSDDEEGPGRRGVMRIKKCAGCDEVVISGQRCHEKTCRARLHDACTGPMWRTQRGEAKCPACSERWTGKDFVGVRAAGVTLNDGGDSASSRRRSERGARTESVELGGADDDDDDD